MKKIVKKFFCVFLITVSFHSDFGDHNTSTGGFPYVSVVKNLPDNARDTGDSGSISGSGRSPGGGNGNPLQDSCLENPRNRGAWWAHRGVHGVTNSQT